MATTDGSLDELALVIVLGAQLVSSPDRTTADRALVPAFHAEMRVAAAAALVSHSRRRPLRFIMSGGYNVGVRYTVDGEQGGQCLLEPAFSFEALADARRGYPSEAYVMKDRLCRHYGVVEGTDAIFVLEEASSTTLENAALCKVLLTRIMRPQSQVAGVQEGEKPVTIGLLTNAYHMSRALDAFSVLEDDGWCRVLPIYAEDYAAILPPARNQDERDWITEIASYYRQRERPLAINSDGAAVPSFETELAQLQDVLQARREGALTRSVAELLHAHNPPVHLGPLSQA